MSDVWRREAARVILIDERSRVLLTAVRDPDDGVLAWIAPGGTVEPGETIEDTALRELAEEVDGPSVYTLDGPVWTRSFFHTFAGRETDLHEWYFVASVAASDIRAVWETGEGARYFEGWRWWTLDELIQQDDPLAPADLATLLPPILRGELPETPFHIADR